MEVPGGQPAENCVGEMPLLTWSTGEREVCDQGSEPCLERTDTGRESPEGDRRGVCAKSLQS